MGTLTDSANIFVGRALDLFTEMERVVARDGDVAGAQAVMSDAMLKVVGSVQTPNTGGTSNTSTKRK